VTVVDTTEVTAVDTTLNNGRTGPIRTFVRARWLELAGTVVFWLYISWPLLRTDRTVVGFDGLAYSGPNIATTARALRNLQLPQWNDTIFGGVSHFANVQVALFNPVKLPFLFLDPLRAVAWITAFGMLLFAVGFVVLAHRLRWRAPAGLVGSVVILGSGLIQLKEGALEQLLVLAWLPWLLAAIDLVFDTPRPRRAIAGVAVLTALILVSGHPQAMFLALAVGGGWALSRACAHGAGRPLLAVAGGCALGGLLAAVQVIPTAILLDGVADKGHRALGYISDPTYVLQPRLIFGAVLGDVTTRFPETLAGTYEAAAFVGAAAVVLALFAVVVATRSRRQIAAVSVWLVTGLAALALAPGTRSPFFRAAFDVVPFFKDARVPARWMAVVTIVLAVLAAQGMDAVARRRVDGRVLATSAVVVVVVVVIAVLGPFDLPEGDAVRWWFVFGGALFVAALLVHLGPRGTGRVVSAALVVIVGLELGLAARGSPIYRASVPPDFGDHPGRAVRFLERHPQRAFAQTEDRLSEFPYLVAGLRPNVNATYDVRSLDGYDGAPQVRAGWADAMSAFTGGSFNSDLTVRAQTSLPLRPDLFARFGVRWLLLETGTIPPEESVPEWGAPVLTQDSLSLYDNPAYDGEAFVYHATDRVAPGHNGSTLRTMDTAELESIALVEDGPDLSCTQPCPRDRARLHRDRPERLVVHTGSGAGGILAVTEQYDQGWHVSVDGESADVVQVDGDLLGVRVPRGAHTVVFTYRTPGLLVGAFLSLLAAIAVVLLLCERSLVPRRVRAFVRDRAGRRGPSGPRRPDEVAVADPA
jgi:hypothetical protein